MRAVLVLILALGAGALIGVLLPPPKEPLPEPAAASATGAETVEFSLVSHTGERIDAADLRGRALLVFFGYTHCPDICPTTLFEMAQVQQGLGERSADFRGLFITIDPARDTAERLAVYVTHFNPALIGLTGSDAEIARAAASFGAAYERGESLETGGYLMGHSGFGYLVAPDGTIHSVFPAGTPASEITRSVIALLDASRS